MTLDFLTGCFGWRPVKLSRCSETLTCIWLWVLKIAVAVPAGIAAFAARKYYMLAQKHPELSHPPYRTDFEYAFQLTYISVSISRFDIVLA